MKMCVYRPVYKVYLFSCQIAAFEVHTETYAVDVCPPAALWSDSVAIFKYIGTLCICSSSCTEFAIKHKGVHSVL